MAERIQLRRVKGWRKPEGAVVVARPTKWGNPWTIKEWNAIFDDLEAARDMAVHCFSYAMNERLEAEVGGEPCLEAEGFYPSLAEIRGELRGKDLACWCALTERCHADVLLEIANAENL